MSPACGPAARTGGWACGRPSHLPPPAVPSRIPSTCWERSHAADAADPGWPPPPPDGGGASEVDATEPAESDSAESAAPSPDGPEIDAAAPDGETDTMEPAFPVAGLVAHWPLDEGQGTVTGDATGNGNDGSLIDGVAWVTSAAPTLVANPSAVRLDGDDEYIELTVRTLPRAESPKTIAVWFRNSATAPRLRNLVALYNETDDAGIHVGFDGDRVAAWRWGDFDPILRSPQAPDGDWHHAAYSWDGSLHRLYLDGTLVASATADLRTGAIETARLGMWEPAEAFDGDLDEVRVYDRMLSSAEIAALAAR